jgi:D-alanine transaminase
MQQPVTVYLNGQFLQKDQASISPDDRGFYFADGVYEVIKYYHGYPFCMDEHLQRLANSLSGTRIIYAKINELADTCGKLIEINQLKSEDSGIYIQITRGASVRRHSFPDTGVKPTIYIYTFPMPSFSNEMGKGVKAITREDIRWHRCNIKSIALLPNTMMFQEAFEQGAFETILVREGNFTEATHSNVLFVKEGAVHTHPDSNLILPGITKSVVFGICKEHSIRVNELPVKAAELAAYDECFITGTGSEIMPVTRIDDTVVGNGKPGPVTRFLQDKFLEITSSLS